ncbi:MAG: TIGR00153 family protein [Defluviitoga tunisiensis]|jgi:predicted phosphate transport protein (TIGR00153 family)|uniref:Phosphate transport regulator n=1 Tax=Defluviitoga tunisiensis TaxID=1006576 RepID=A0A0C7NTQ2_DEFTU|nr:TIGR00153 family protein [Defluviitoga tunisiensis]MDD3600662.1 TIGR00153 family protein [Defluviitoga tunisiensis]MDY0378983.1 TIGR00153 family protein [Defluviitoga tunisiensis]CEP79117.1 Phosphate transport regulator [Defluviitoga tunisiensis]HHV00702.1 TIGR00153 family protein [Defluviitoga tunisiensis]HOB55209.1 TIGR00153 family protein [Defluviitoga tunisiensis]
MRLFVGKKEEKVKDLVFKHLDKIQEGLDVFQEVLELYLTNQYEEMMEKVQKVSLLENQADILRRKSISVMYEGAFLPNLRGELLALIESVDKVMNKIQSVSESLDFQRPKIPEEFKEDILKQNQYVRETYKHLKSSIESLFLNIEKTNEDILKVEEFEHKEDVLEKSMIKKLFSMGNLELAEKLELRDIFSQIGDIADRAEDASDRVSVIVLKRKVK